MQNNDLEALFHAVKSGDEKTAAAMGEKIKSGLSREKTQMLERALTDGGYLESLLSSDRARRILDEFKKKEEG